jgi:hypothetical protein
VPKTPKTPTIPLDRLRHFSTLPLWVDDDLRADLQRVADWQGTNRSAVARRLLSQGLRRELKRAGIEGAR